MRTMLMLASVASMIDQFNIPNIRILQKMGYKVHVACNFEYGSTCSYERVTELKKQLKKMEIPYYQVDFTRNVADLKRNIIAYRQVLEILRRNNFDFVHCHSPIGGAIGRLACHKLKIKVIYTAHGFHFFKGAPLKNWLLYYPIEKYLSKYTDILITINKEDFYRATKKFNAQKIEYIPGVGVDVSKFRVCNVNREKKRLELGIPEEGFVLFSVLKVRNIKSLKLIFSALNKIGNPNIYYLIAGEQEILEESKLLLKEYGLADNVIVFMNKVEVDKLCESLDCFVDFSLKDNSDINLIEAMASGLPVISLYKNQGGECREKCSDTNCLENCVSLDGLVNDILKMYVDSNYRTRCASISFSEAKRLDVYKEEKIKRELYSLSMGYNHVAWLYNRQKVRLELGFDVDDFVLISVGELNSNKNHMEIIKALSKISDLKIKYIIVGTGKLSSDYLVKVKELNLEARVKLLGFQLDVGRYLHASDAFVFPSKREGLGLAAIEAMASGLPLITSNVHGINDYSVDGISGYRCDNRHLEQYENAIMSLKSNIEEQLRFMKNNISVSNHFSSFNTDKIMKSIYDECMYNSSCQM